MAGFARPFLFIVIARSEATKQSRDRAGRLDCFASLAMTSGRLPLPFVPVPAVAGINSSRDPARNFQIEGIRYGHTALDFRFRGNERSLGLAPDTRRRPCCLKARARLLPFFLSPKKGNGAPGGASGLRGRLWAGPLRSGRPRADFRKQVCEACSRARAPLAIGVLRLPALHYSAHIVGAPALLFWPSTFETGRGFKQDAERLSSIGGLSRPL